MTKPDNAWATGVRRSWPLIAAVLTVSAMATTTTALAQQISADRPGVGSDADVVPQFTVQGEAGTDSREVRLGLFPGFEIDRDDTSWAAKLALIDRPKLKLSIRGAIDDSGQAAFELPASVTINSLVYLTTDIIWTRAAQTYAAEINLTPSARLTITPVAYYDTKARAALFAAWVLPGTSNVQVDIGYDQHKLIVGISTALNLAKLLH